MTRLKLRIENLEQIVYELLRNRVHKEQADAWLDLPNRGFMENRSFKDRGKTIATLMDRWDNENTRWPEREPLK